MHGASAAQRHSATEFRARHAEHVAQNPKKRRVAIDVDGMAHAVDVDRVWHWWCLRASPAGAGVRLAGPTPPIVGRSVLGTKTRGFRTLRTPLFAVDGPAHSNVTSSAR